MRLRDGAAAVRFGNPLGPSPVDLLRRSHKKLAVVDERVVYLGGINFSDHNFAWHDMMLRVEDPELGRLYRDTGRPELALEEAEHVLALPVRSPMEEAARGEAQRLKRALTGGVP